MRNASNIRQARTTLLAAVCVAIVAHGCSRTRYRQEADCDAYSVISERNGDPRWSQSDVSIDIDPRSRYFDPYDPDCPPIPPDDPTAHRYMQCVDGRKGWEHWYDNGQRMELENPGWRQALGQYVGVNPDGAVKLDVNSALRLAYVHSPNHQNQLETLYLSALEVTEERFSLDTQIFGGYDTVYDHNGRLIPAGLDFDAASGHFVVAPPAVSESAERNRLTLGRPDVFSRPTFEARRSLATAGQVLARFANSFVVEFTGGDANLHASLANITFIQPLLARAGRDVALERLTVTERNLLANLRAYSQFRQGFYTLVAIGDLGVNGPQQGGRGTNLTSFSGEGGVDGYLGLLQRLQQKRNSEDNLNLQVRTLEQLEFRFDAGSIDLVQVDQFRQSVERERANLLRIENDYELALDRYKTRILGLPPDLPVDLDDTLIQQFQLIPRDATAVLDRIVELQNSVGALPRDVGAERLTEILPELFELIEPVRQQLNTVPADLERMEEVAPTRERRMLEKEREAFRRDREELRNKLTALDTEFQLIPGALEDYRDGLTAETSQVTRRGLIVWLRDIRRIVERSVLVRAGARLESITVEYVAMLPRAAYGIALANRLDFMNGRAALVDSWRLIQVNADALQSVLDFSASGTVRTARNNPLDFRAATSDAQVALRFDAPFTRLVERNDYRGSLINYQRSRRTYIQSRDQLYQGLRALLRQIRLLRANMEIQRRAVTIAIRQVDLTQAELDAPIRPAQPGQRSNRFGPTATINLLSATSSLRDSQNALLGVWLDYYATRIRLARELGIMSLDHEGGWLDLPLPGSDDEPPVDGDGSGDDPDPAEQPLPPVIPTEWIELANHLDELKSDSSGDRVQAAGYLDALPSADRGRSRRARSSSTVDDNEYDSVKYGPRTVPRHPVGARLSVVPARSKPVDEQDALEIFEFLEAEDGTARDSQADDVSDGPLIGDETSIEFGDWRSSEPGQGR